MVLAPRACLVVLALAATAAHAADATPSPDVYAPIAMEAGTWDGAITFFDNDQPAGTATGVQTNTMLANGHWITNDFRVEAQGKLPLYQGHGVWGWDPVAQAYVDTWVDTNDGAVRTDYGFWQADKHVMTWSAKQSDGKGHFVDYRMVEEFQGDTRTFTVYQLGIVTPNPHPLVRIVFTRRRG
jgi:hypothetical protein